MSFSSKNGSFLAKKTTILIKKNSHFVGSKFHPIKEHGDSVFGNDPILVKELKETIANQRVNQPIIAVKTYNET